MRVLPRSRALHAALLLVSLATSPLAGRAAGPGEETAPVVRRTSPAVTETVVPGDLPEDPSSFRTTIRTEERRGEGSSVEDLLGDAVGVQVRRFGGPGQPAEVSIRGSTPSQVVILLDGVRLNTAQSGTVDLSTIPAALLDRIEITRGGGSAQEGSDAVGGVIDLVTKRPGEEPETELWGSGGSFGTWEGGIRHASRSGPFELSAAYDGFKTDGDWEFRRREIRFAGGASIVARPDPLERINDRSERHVALLSAGADLGEQVHVTLSDYLGFVSRGQPGLDSGGGATGGQRARAHERSTRNLASLRAEAVGLPLGLESSLRLYHRFERVRFQDPEPALGDPISVDDENESLGGRLLFERRGRTLAAEHRGSASLDLRQDVLHAEERPTERRDTFGLFVQDEIAVLGQRLRLVPGVRLDDTEGLGEEWLPRIGAVLEPVSWLRLKANAERSYRAPNLDELFFPDEGFIRGNPGLEPEEAVNLDAGFEIGLDRLGPLREIRLESAWFRNDIRNSIVWVLINPSTLQPQNTGDATAQGVEAALSFGVTPWARLSGNYTWLDATLDDTGAPLPGRAENEVTGRIELGPPSRALRLVGEVHFTDDIPLFFEGLSAVSDRTVLGASVIVDLVALGVLRGPRWPESVLLSAGGTNLSDQSVRDAESFPQPGRQLFARLELRW